MSSFVIINSQRKKYIHKFFFFSSCPFFFFSYFSDVYIIPPHLPTFNFSPSILSSKINYHIFYQLLISIQSVFSSSLSTLSSFTLITLPSPFLHPSFTLPSPLNKQWFLSSRPCLTFILSLSIEQQIELHLSCLSPVCPALPW